MGEEIDREYLEEKGVLKDARGILNEMYDEPNNAPDGGIYHAFIPEEGYMEIDKAVGKIGGKIAYKKAVPDNDDISVVFETDSREKGVKKLLWFYQEADEDSEQDNETDEDSEEEYEVVDLPLGAYDGIERLDHTKIAVKDLTNDSYLTSNTAAQLVAQNIDLERDLMLPTVIDDESRLAVIDIMEYEEAEENESNIWTPPHVESGTKSSDDEEKESLSYTAGFIVTLGDRVQSPHVKVNDRFYMLSFDHTGLRGPEQSLELVNERLEHMSADASFKVSEEDVREKAYEIANSIDLDNLEKEFAKDDLLKDTRKWNWVSRSIEEIKEWD